MNKDFYLQVRERNKTSRKDEHLVANWFIDIALVGFVIWAAVSQNYFLYFLAVPVISAICFRAFSMMHDAVHGALSENKFLNDTAGTFYGIFSMLPFELWKKSHLEHHFWSSNIEKDPVMAILIVFPKFQQHTKNVLSAIWRSWFPILALMQYGVFWMLSAKIVISKPTKKNLISVGVTFISWLLFFKFSLTHFLLMSLIPGILLYFVMVEVVNLPHHLQMNFNTDDARLPAWQQEVTARTCKYPKWISQYITLNFNYHVEHHLFPDAPWFTLENIHHDLVNSKQVSYVVDEGFQWIIENKNNSLDQVLKTATKFDHKISNAS